jgi:transposase
MKARIKVGIGIKRELFERLDDTQKAMIVNEITTGMIGIRAAGRKYGVHRNSMKAWVDKYNIATLVNEETVPLPSDMIETRQTALLIKQVQTLTKALAHEQLKNIALETMIEVAESDLHVKIRKKRGTKQSSE